MPPIINPYAQNIFGPVQPMGMRPEQIQFPTAQGPIQAPPTSSIPGTGITSDAEGIFIPQETATKYYNDLMRDRPEMEQTGRLRSVMAALASLRDPQASENIIYGRHNRDVQAWNEKIRAAQPAMVQERETNRIGRQLHSADRTDALNREKLALAERAQAENERKNREAESNRRFRAAAYDYSQRNPNWKMEHDVKTGRVVTYNPDNPTERDWLRTPDGDFVMHGDLSETDKLNIRHAQTVWEIAERGVQQRLTNQERPNREKLQSFYDDKGGIVGTYWVDEQNQIIRPATSDDMGRVSTTRPPASTMAGAKEETQTQRRDRIFNNAQKAKIDFPELSDYIRADANDVVTLAPPSTGRFSRGPTPDQYRRLYKAIYGEDPPSDSPVAVMGAEFANPNTAVPTPTPAGNSRIPSRRPNPGSVVNTTDVPVGKIRVRRKSDGQTGTISEAAFNPELYERIQ